MKLLCVDDEQTFLQYLSKRLQEEGMQVFVAFSGEEALTMAAKNRFDAALIGFPILGMGGEKLQEKLHQIDPDLPCIFLVEPLINMEDEACKEDIFLRKPVEMGLLVSTINKAYEKKNTCQGKEKAIPGDRKNPSESLLGRLKSLYSV